jgi:5'-nucleotidase
MNILLTNDDGIDSPGIDALFEELSHDHTVYMFAPKDQKSACSNAITIHHDLRIDFVDDRKFAVHGYPADCTNIGIHSDLCPAIDLVVSGINHGPNLGDDIHYSGTVAGARSAVIFGIPGIAVSINTYEKPEFYNQCAAYVSSFIKTHSLLHHNPPTFININYPDITSEEILGEKFTKQGRRSYIDNYIVTEKSENHISYILKGDVISDNSSNTDTAEILKNYITITPLQLDSTNYSLLEDKLNE